MNSVEFGKCSICGKEDFLQRTYFRYNIKCECHSPYHFELVIHCKNCIPVEPKITKIQMKTEHLDKLFREEKIKNIMKNVNR